VVGGLTLPRSRQRAKAEHSLGMMMKICRNRTIKESPSLRCRNRS
jgi:hypothetical protein